MAYPYLEHISTTRQTDIATFDKKFEYILETIIPQYMKTKYPKFVDYMKVYGRFLDSQFENIGYNLIDLYNPSVVNDSILDNLLNQYFKNVINQNEIIITDDNKRLFIELSKVILNLKLNKNSINFLFKNLRDYSVVDSSGNFVEVESLTIEYSENEEWWLPRQEWFDNNPTSTPYEVYPQDLQTKPFTYSFNFNNAVEAIQVLLKSVHPIGYLVEFIKTTLFTEDPIYVSDVSLIDGFVINKYDNRCIYNGAIDYSGNSGAIRLEPGITVIASSGVWVEYKTVSIDFLKIDEVLTNFPILLNISEFSGFDDTDMRNLFVFTEGDYKRLQIRASDGATPLFAEVENWDVTIESAQLHVKLPSISNNELTQFKIFYKTGIANNNYTDITGSIAAENVWDENYLMVQHMAQDPSNDAPQILDSTSNDNDGISINMDVSNLVYGLYGKSINFNGIDEIITFGDVLPSITHFTISTLFKMVSTIGFNPFFVKGSVINNQIDYMIGTDNGELIFLYNSAGEWHSVSTVSANLAIDTYYNITFKISQTAVLNIEIFVDGVSIQSILLPNLLEHNNYSCYIGYDTNSLYYNGIIDELKFSNILRSPAYIKAENYSLRDDLITMEVYDIGAWTHFKTITIDNNRIVEDIVEFPFMLHISGSSGYTDDDITEIFTLVDDDHTRIQIRANDGVTPLYTEIEKWDIVNKVAVFYTKIPLVSSSVNTVIKIFYYTGVTVPINEYIDVIGTEIGENVWDANYLMVQHMAQDPSGDSPQMIDSTDNSYDGTSVNMDASNLTDGLVGKALIFNGSDERIDLGNVLNSPTDFTVTALVNEADNTQSDNHIIAKGDAVEGRVDYIMALYHGEISLSYNPYGTWYTTTSSGANLQSGISYIITFKITQTTTLNIDFFVDGVLVHSVSLPNLLANNGYNCYIGHGSHTYYFGGTIDELRFSNIARSTAYIKAEQYSLHDNLATYDTYVAATWVEFATVTIDSTKIDTDLTDYAFMINITDSSGTTNIDITEIFTLTEDDHTRIQIRANDGVTPLYTEIEKWDTVNESAQLHVKVPSISNTSSTVIKIFYYTGVTVPINNYIDVIGTEIGENVWDANYLMVQHMASDPSNSAPQMIDSTDNNHDGTSVNMDTSNLVNGLVGKAIMCDGVNEYVNLGNVLNSSTNFTLSAIVRIADNTKLQNMVFVKGNAVSGDVDYMFTIEGSEINFLWNPYGTWYTFNTVGANLQSDIYYNITWRITQTSTLNIDIYVDGVKIHTESSPNLLVHNNYDCFIGHGSHTYFFNGIIDNVRFSNSARSEAHVKATNYTLRDTLATIALV